MAKPINPYQGPAPAAMAQMGAGILETGANIARMTQAGYESMGKGIAGGINTAVGEYAKYKEDQAKFNASKKMLDAFGGSLGEKEKEGIKNIFADTSMSIQEKNALAPTLMQFLGASQQQKQTLEKQQQEQQAAMARQQAANQAQQEQPFYNQAAGMMQQPGMAPNKSFGYGGGMAPSGVSLQGSEPFSFGQDMYKKHGGF